MSAPAQKASPILPESLSGLIERVTFTNEDSGFSVLKVKVKGHRDLVTVVGSLPSVSAGEWLTAQGRWVQDREFGLQFRAEMLTSTPPTTNFFAYTGPMPLTIPLPRYFSMPSLVVGGVLVSTSARNCCPYSLS